MENMKSIDTHISMKIHWQMNKSNKFEHSLCNPVGKPKARKQTQSIQYSYIQRCKNQKLDK